jgi:hypothetical protein
MSSTSMEMEPTEKTFFITIYQPFSVMGGGRAGDLMARKGGGGLWSIMDIKK